MGEQETLWVYVQPVGTFPSGDAHQGRTRRVSISCDLSATIKKEEEGRNSFRRFVSSIAEVVFVVGFVFVATALCKHSVDLFFLVERR